jgi:hypothetical protein
MSAARVAHEGTPYNEQGSFLLKMMLFRSDTIYKGNSFFEKLRVIWLFEN